MYVRVTPTNEGLMIEDPVEGRVGAVFASYVSVSNPAYSNGCMYGVLESWRGYRMDKDAGFVEASLRRKLMRTGLTDGLYMSENRKIAQVQFNLEKLTKNMSEDPTQREVFGSPIAATALFNSSGEVEIYQTEDVLS